MRKLPNYVRIVLTSLVLALLVWPGAAMAQTSIDPSTADFGDVVVDTKETLIVTIMYTGDNEYLFKYSLPVNPCGFTASGDNNLVLSSARSSTEITVGWTPSEPGQCSAELQIINGRSVAALITVTGNGVLEPATTGMPDITNLVDAFDNWVAKGEIVGKGRGKAGAHYIKAYRNLLVKAIHLMERGQARKAYMKLMMAQKMSRFLLKGYAVWDLRHEINLVLADLKQAGTWPVQVAQEEWPETGILLEAFDEWVQSGDIKGKGAGKNAAKQVQQYRNMLEKASDLMERGRKKQAYSQLADARKLTRVFLGGAAVDDLREMLNDMLESLRA